jgi:competence ComEA-like helix-hairpin-helix protein
MNNADFSKRSLRAILIFVVLLIVFAIIPRIVIYYTPEKPIHFSWKESERIRSFKPVEQKQWKSKYIKKSYKTPSKKFDPNTYSVADWMNLGLSQKQAEAVLKFGKYGFKSKEDLKHVFVIPQELMMKIIDSTFYPVKIQSNTQFAEIKKEQKIKIIDLNFASEEELQSIKGIGPFFAKNIFKRREQLGGFINVEQLLEVWKMTPEKVEELKPYIQFDPLNVKKMNINVLTAEEFKKHPYFTWNIANAIVKLRNQHGPFKSINDLKMSVVLSEELFLKIKPYLTI